MQELLILDSTGNKKATPVRELEHCWIPMSDGVRLAARLWLPGPADAEPVPAVLEYIPYRKRDMVRARDERNHPYLARHGYACVRVDMRGSGDSEGLMSDMYTRAELDDAVDLIHWIANQPWCNGSVGMMGTSWGGTASLQAAARRPHPLKAIIAVCATNDRFDDDIHHAGGCLLTDSIEWGATLPAILASPPDPETVGAAWRSMWRARLEGLSFPLEDWIRHETRDGYWRRGSVNETPDAITCPVLAIGGWMDRYSNTVMNLLADIGDNCWGIIGPWGHHYPDMASPGPAIGFPQEARRWWDRWLKGVDNGIEEMPRLRVWLRDYVEPSDRMGLSAGTWISEQDWPSRRVHETELCLTSGRLQSQPGDMNESATVPSAPGVSPAAGDTGYFGRDGGLPLDQRGEDAGSLVFDSQPLDHPLTLIGAARLTVWVSTDRPVATLVGRLNDVPPEGGVVRVAWGVRNLALDAGGARRDENTSRRFRRCVIEFPNTAYRFQKGHRIRLALSGSYWPLIWPAPQPASIVLRCHRTRLSLPIREGVEPDGYTGLSEPIAHSNPDIEVISAPELKRWSETDTDHQVVGWHQPFRHVRFKSIDLDFGSETRALHTLDISDPLSAESRFEHRLHYARGDWSADVTGIARLTCTLTTFELQGSVEARENRQTIFHRDWNVGIPRTCS